MTNNDIQELAKQIVSLPLSAAAALREELKTLLNLSDAAISGVGSGPMMAQPNAEEAPKAAEKTEFDILLKDAGSNKTAVIKLVREYLKKYNGQEKGLMEVKNLVTETPTKILVKVGKQAADEVIKALKEAGAECVAE